MTSSQNFFYLWQLLVKFLFFLKFSSSVSVIITHLLYQAHRQNPITNCEINSPLPTGDLSTGPWPVESHRVPYTWFNPLLSQSWNSEWLCNKWTAFSLCTWHHSYIISPASSVGVASSFYLQDWGPHAKSKGWGWALGVYHYSRKRMRQASSTLGTLPRRAAFLPEAPLGLLERRVTFLQHVLLLGLWPQSFSS